MGGNNLENETRLPDHSYMDHPEIHNMMGNVVDNLPQELIPDVDIDTPDEEDSDLDDLEEFFAYLMNLPFEEQPVAPELGQNQNVLGEGLQSLENNPPGSGSEPVEGSSSESAQGPSLGNSLVVGDGRPQTNVCPVNHETLQVALDRVRQRLLEMETRVARVEANLRR